MARRSGGRAAPRAASRPAPVRNPPQPASRAPAPAPVQGNGGSMVGGLGATIAEGMAFGTGSAMAHRAVDAIIGPRTIQHEVSQATAPDAIARAATMKSADASDACTSQSRAFLECLNSYGTDITKCQFYMDMLSECRRNSGSMLST